MTTDIEIARRYRLRPIEEIASRAGIAAEALIPYGRDKAKIDLSWLETRAAKPDGKLILVTAVNPTPPGEGKTTTTIGLGDALNRIGKHAVIALREPSLGPVFGRKGGATGGGHAQVAPMDAINLHFTGDFHAITAAHNLLAALIDNHLYWGNALGLDPRRIVWRRVVDMNDRALREIVVGLGDNGAVRETGFDITVASEVMAILCLAESRADLEERLGRIIVGRTREGALVTARDLKADGAMAALLKEAVNPNLVQTLEGSPALIHGGPFANIAHGCNSVIATKAALKLGDYVVTEAGFGADLGAEKFLNIKCRASGLKPAAAVVVATLRALKYQGGGEASTLAAPDAAALEAGLANLARHVENLGKFGLPAIVAINHFAGDSVDEHAAVARFCAENLGAQAIVCRHWAEGAAGAETLARAVVALAEKNSARFEPLYPANAPLAAKIEAVARQIYRASGVAIAPRAMKDLECFEKDGFGGLPVCIAKTPYSFSADESLLGAPTGHTLPVREARLAAGAGFVVAICGDVMTMPGLPKAPNAAQIRLDAEGRIEGIS